MIVRIDTNKAIYNGEFYRLFSGTLTFATNGELIFGSMTLIPLLRRFEREMGSRKFMVFLGMVTLFSIAFQVSVAQLFLEDGLRYSGPYPALGAMLWLFHTCTPSLHPHFFGVLGFHFSEKSIQYAFGAQAVLYRGLASLIPTICGMLACYLACLSPINKLDLPDPVVSIVAVIFGRFVESPPDILAVRLGPINMAAPSAAAGVERPPPEPVFQQLPPPDESSIEQLTSMGFERDAVLQALQQSHNNVERAADRLLMGS
jgi:UBA/TS-N domain